MASSSATRSGLGGVAFSLGLVLVVVAGAELFTGNNLIVIAWADGRIGTASLLRNWALVYAANFAGAVGAALLVHWSGILGNSGGAVGRTAIAIARSKVELGFAEAFFRGVLAGSGLFLTFDVIWIHWIFGLHHLTNTPAEDVILEPALVIAGAVMLYLGLRRGREPR